MNKLFIPGNWRRSKLFLSTFLLSVLLLTFEFSYSQCTILENAVEGISYTTVQAGGSNAGGVAYNPGFDVYYAAIAGNPTFPYETFNSSGTSLYQTITGFDFRGVWWNANTGAVEGNGYDSYGLWTSDLDLNGYALSTGTNLFTGQNQPDAQSCGDYDYDANEIIYYFNGSIYRYDRTTDTYIGSYSLTGFPVPISNINWTSVIYTGCCGNEIGLEDYVNKTILLFNKSTGAYSGTSQLPASAVTNSGFNFSYANNLVWLHDVYAHKWISYSILTGSAGGNEVNLGNDTALCIGSSLVLSAGSSSFQYEWSTGSIDSTITVDTAGTYWLTVTNGVCVASDTIIILDTLCSPLVGFNSSDTAICEKFCIDFFDSSQNNPTAWLWLFTGASPATSTDQNPMNICYNDSGTYDVTLITTGAAGNDTITLPDYVTVFTTPPLPTITQNNYVLTASAGSVYQWQFNSVDIPGATNQSYTVLQTGLYTVLVYDANGCKNSASLFVQIVGINEVSNTLNVSVFPNPCNGSFMIELSTAQQGETISIRVENSIGQLIYSSSEEIRTTHLEKGIDLPNVASGVYILEIRTNDGYSKSKIIVTE